MLISWVSICWHTKSATEVCWASSLKCLYISETAFRPGANYAQFGACSDQPVPGERSWAPLQIPIRANADNQNPFPQRTPIGPRSLTLKVTPKLQQPFLTHNARFAESLNSTLARSPVLGDDGSAVAGRAGPSPGTNFRDRRFTGGIFKHPDDARRTDRIRAVSEWRVIQTGLTVAAIVRRSQSAPD